MFISTARCHASAVYAVVMCLSVTCWYCIKTAKHKIMQTMPHRDSSFIMPKTSVKFEWGHP